MTTLIALVLIAGLAWIATTEAQRAQALRTVRPVVHGIRTYGLDELEPYYRRLRERRVLALATMGLVALNLVVFIGTRLGAGDVSGAAALVGRGASLGPRTTNGEWWRLVSAMFVHAGLFPLMVNMAVLYQVGRILERLVGRTVFLTAYVGGGVLAEIVHLRAEPLSVHAGSANAVLGVYGLLLASVALGWWRRSDWTIPLIAIQRLLPLAAIFLLYNFVAGSWTAAQGVALASGIVLGVVVVRDVRVAAPPLRRTGAAVAVGLVAVAVSAFFLRGILDVGPEIQRLVALEQTTADAYGAAVRQFRSGRVTIDALTELIERSILPELEAADLRIRGLEGVPHADEARIEHAREYLQLRAESWRLRAEGLRAGSVPDDEEEGMSAEADVRSARNPEATARHRATARTLGRAEGTERRALEALGLADTTRGQV